MFNRQFLKNMISYDLQENFRDNKSGSTCLIYFHGYEVTLILYQRLKFHYVHARIRRGEGAGDPDPPEKSQKYRVF